MMWGLDLPSAARAILIYAHLLAFAAAVAAIAGKPKLLTKLAVVSILSANGFLLHRLAFPRITQSRDAAARSAVLPAVLGGVSAASWGYAAFLGVARPFAPLGFSGLMGVYFALLAVAVGVAWVFVRPRLARQIPPPGMPRFDARESPEPA